MPILTDLDTIWTEKDQREQFFVARASLENATRVLREELVRFNDIKQTGNFNTLPANLKAALLRWETEFKDVETMLLADAEIVDIYEWRP